MNDFEEFKRAVSLLNKHCEASADFDDVARKLGGDIINEFHDMDFIAYISALDNTIQEGLTRVLTAVDPGFEGED